jgi:multiple sugar transport system substrate-binding protein
MILKSYKKTFFLELFFILFLFYLSGCAKKPMRKTSSIVPIRVAFWGSPEEVNIISEMVKEWQQNHPKIKVILEHTPYSGYESKVLTRIAGGDAPDVMAAEVGLFTNFWGRGVFLDLTPFINEDKEFNKQDFFPQIWGRFQVNGKVYGIPRDVAPFACIYYNKKIFDKLKIPYPKDDWDWEKFYNCAKALTKIDEKGRVKRYGFYTWAWQNFVYSNGGSLVDNVKNPKHFTLNSQESLDGLRFYLKLIKERISPTPSALVNMGMGVEMMFMTQKLAMLGSGIWETPLLRKIKKFDWDIVMFPKGPKEIRKFGSGGTAYCILKTTKHPDEAWRVVEALTSIEAMQRMAMTGLAQPARISVAESKFWAKNNQPPLNKAMLNKAVEYIVFPPFHPKWREIEKKYLQPKLDLIFNEEKDLEQGINEVAPEAEKLLTKGEPR